MSGEAGIVSVGSAFGAARTRTPRASSTIAVVYATTVLRQGTVFSMAMMAATNAIQETLMTPRANSDAIKAQQHPTHQAPFVAPIRTAPEPPSRHDPSSTPSGLRHLPRQTSFSGVTS